MVGESAGFERKRQRIFKTRFECLNEKRMAWGRIHEFGQGDLIFRNKIAGKSFGLMIKDATLFDD